MQVIHTRVFFQKVGRLKFISHLDTMNVFIRAINRAKIPVWYTRGYNPRVYVSFPFPMSLGYEGLRESFDIRLVEEMDFDEIRQRLNAVLPDQLNVISVAEPVEDPRAVKYADYSLSIEFWEKDTEKGVSVFGDYLSKDKIVVEKKSKKRGSIPMDITPYVEIFQHTLDGNYLDIKGRFVTGMDFNLNPRLFVDGFEDFSKINIRGFSASRERLLDRNKELFK